MQFSVNPGKRGGSTDVELQEIKFVGTHPPEALVNGLLHHLDGHRSWHRHLKASMRACIHAMRFVKTCVYEYLFTSLFSQECVYGCVR